MALNRKVIELVSIDDEDVNEYIIYGIVSSAESHYIAYLINKGLRISLSRVSYKDVFLSNPKNKKSILNTELFSEHHDIGITDSDNIRFATYIDDSDINRYKYFLLQNKIGKVPNIRDLISYDYIFIIHDPNHTFPSELLKEMSSYIKSIELFQKVEMNSYSWLNNYLK